MSQRIQNIELDSARITQTGSEGGRRVRVATYRVGMEGASFYVQSRGLYAGRPLSQPIPNCWAVYTDLPYLQQIAYSIYKSCLLDPMRIGSVIPFIRLREYRSVLLKAADLHETYDPKSLEVLALIDEKIDLLRQQMKALVKYQIALALKINLETHLLP